jgi:hypothetical protein
MILISLLLMARNRQYKSLVPLVGAVFNQSLSFSIKHGKQAKCLILSTHDYMYLLHVVTFSYNINRLSECLTQ